MSARRATSATGAAPAAAVPAAAAVLAAAALAAATAAPAAQAPPASPGPGGETIAITGGRVLPLGGRPALDPGTVVIRDGRIAEVRAGRDAPPDARVIDAAGHVVTPGLIAADTRLGLVEIDLESTTRDDAVGFRDDDHNHAAFRAADSINPRSALIPVARLQGVTSSLVVPTGGLVAGQSALLDLTGPDRDRMVARPSVAVHANLGLGGAGAAGGSRGFALVRLREMLDDARFYRARRDLFDRNQARALRGSRLDLDALAPAAEGRQVLALHADREADLLAAIDLAREQRLRVVILGAAEGWRVADRLAAAGIPVLVDPTENLPASFDTLQARLDNAARLFAAGVRVGITLRGETHNARTLRQRAGIAASYGLPHEAALAAASSAVADAFGLSPAHGTLAPGAVANVVIWTGDPLELSTRAARVFVQGVELPPVSRQTLLRDRYLDLSRVPPALPAGSAAPAAEPPARPARPAQAGPGAPAGAR